MCQRIQCRQCGRPTWAGCGMHVEQVLGDVPRDQRCRCREEKAAAKAAAKAAPGAESGGWLRKLLGR